MMIIHDISRTLDENILIYPGDSGISINNFKKNDWNLSEISLGSHTGTHVDTKLHLVDGSPGVDKIHLDKCIGKCTVFDLTNINLGESIGKVDLLNLGIKEGEIVLLKTRNSYLNTGEFQENFISISVESAEYLVGIGIKTIAFDYLSVGSRETHEMLLKNDILVFENVDLSDINPGSYTFIGLPIKIKTEGAPARVILLEE